MAKYKVGDKVRVLDHSNEFGFSSGMRKYIGKVLTVSHVDPLPSTAMSYQLKEATHASCPYGFWWWDEDWLAPVNGITKKLIVTTDGETTTAKLIDGKQTIKTATAKCSKDDEFCFETGARIAVNRLLEEKPVEPEKPKFTKADLRNGMFGFNMVHDCEECQWFVVCNGLFVYETGGFDRIDGLDDSMRFPTPYGYVGTVIDGAISFDNARGMYGRRQGIVYERK